MYKKIFVMGYNFVTGGPETMHQVVDVINSNGGEAYMVYPNLEDKCPEEFKTYNCKFATEIEDEEDNLLVVSEIATEKLFKYKKIKKCILWLSKNYYFENIYYYSGKIKNYDLNNGIKRVFKPMLFFLDLYKKHFMFGPSKNNIIHTYNCEYLREFLEKKGVSNKNMVYICGPLSQESFSENINKKNVVAYAYSKSKGIYYIDKIIEKFKQEYSKYEYRPIIGMNHKEVIDTLAEAKVYIDFGSFPGPERIPREAVLNKCNIITSNFGAASNNIDVPIPCKYKYSKDNFDLDDISAVFYELMEHYSEHVNEYEEYRNKVINQKKEFENNIINTFIK